MAGGEEEEEDENNDGWEICSSEEEMDGWSDNDEGWIDVEHSEKEEVQVSEIFFFFNLLLFLFFIGLFWLLCFVQDFLRKKKKF